MKNKNESIIVCLILCIVFTPILVCTGIKGLGGLISIWIAFAVIWYVLYGKDMLQHDKYKKEDMNRIVVNEEKKINYEKKLPLLIKEREKQRRSLQMVTDSSFKEYMHSFGFDVEGNIDVGRLPTWEEHRRNPGKIIYPSKPTFEKYSEIKIITHKSMNELKRMGIIDVKQLLGEYFKCFGYCMNNEDGGFYCGEKKEYTNGFDLVTVEDSHNMCATVKYTLDYDNNVSVKWSNDYIYHIVRRPVKKSIKKTNKIELEKWLPESINDVNINGHSNVIDILYWRYVIYRDSGCITKDGSFSLTEKEKRFIMLASEKKSIVKKYYDCSSVNNYVEHYQIDTDNLTKINQLLE